MLALPPESADSRFAACFQNRRVDSLTWNPPIRCFALIVSRLENSAVFDCFDVAIAEQIEGYSRLPNDLSAGLFGEFQSLKRLWRTPPFGVGMKFASLIEMACAGYGFVAGTANHRNAVTLRAGNSIVWRRKIRRLDDSEQIFVAAEWDGAKHERERAKPRRRASYALHTWFLEHKSRIEAFADSWIATERVFELAGDPLSFEGVGAAIAKAVTCTLGAIAHYVERLIMFVAIEKGSVPLRRSFRWSEHSRTFE
jgi:hypothetical protein